MVGWSRLTVGTNVILIVSFGFGLDQRRFEMDAVQQFRHLDGFQSLLSSIAPMFQQRQQHVPGEEPMQGRADFVFRTVRSAQDTTTLVEFADDAG